VSATWSAGRGGDGALAADPGLAGRGRHPGGHRLGHRGHDHRGRDRRAACRGPGRPDRRAARAGDRRGSLFFSHVNDAGFWLVKEYFGLTVGQTIKSWSVLETIISVLGLVLVLVLSAFV